MMAVWVVLLAALVFIIFLRDEVRMLKISIKELDSGIIRQAAIYREELLELRNEIESSLDEIRGHVGFEEHQRWLDENVIWKEEYRRLGSIFPRLNDLEVELEEFQRNARELQLINGLKDQTQFPKEEQRRVLAQLIREKNEKTEHEPSPRPRGLNQANSEGPPQPISAP